MTRFNISSFLIYGFFEANLTTMFWHSITSLLRRIVNIDLNGLGFFFVNPLLYSGRLVIAIAI
jgi:hypothetical protein